jgi:TRAP-type C4-dicarboxylate transport system substrate-binding protein
MTIVKRALLLLVLVLCAIGPVFAQRKVSIRLASPAPENTPWGKALNQIASEWAKVSNGQVELKVFHGGVLGSEDDMLRKLRGGAIEAGVFTSIGLSSITPEIMTLSAPFLIRNDAELEAVLKDLRADLGGRLNGQGFFTVAWANSGWVKVFSKKEVFVPADLKRMKVASSEGTPTLNDAFKKMGYQIIPVSLNDLLVSLNSGQTEALYLSPLYVGGMQLFGIANNMMSTNIAPFLGAIVVNQRIWRQVPDQYKDQLANIAQRIATGVGSSVNKLESDAVKTMTSHGLKVNVPSPEQEKLWHEDIQRVMPSLLENKTFDRDLYQKINGIVARYRGGR